MTVAAKVTAANIPSTNNHPRRVQPLSGEQIERIFALRDQQHTLDFIATELGCASRDVLRARLQKQGIILPRLTRCPGRLPPLSTDQIERIYAWRKQQRSFEAIAQELGISRTGLMTGLDGQGITLPPATPKRPLTPAQISAAIMLRNLGRSWLTIGREIKADRKRVARELRAHGASVSFAPVLPAQCLRKSISPDQLQSVIAARKLSQPWSRIEKQMGVHRKTILRHLAAAGLAVPRGKYLGASARFTLFDNEVDAIVKMRHQGRLLSYICEEMRWTPSAGQKPG